MATEISVADFREDGGMYAERSLASAGFDVDPPLLKKYASIDYSSLDDADFGLITAEGQRLFPAFDRESALLSSFYVKKHASVLSPAELASAVVAIQKHIPTFELAGVVKSADVIAFDDVLNAFFGEVPDDIAIEQVRTLVEEAAPIEKRAFASSLPDVEAASQLGLADYFGDGFGTLLEHSVTLRKYSDDVDPQHINVLDQLVKSAQAGAITPDQAVQVLEAFDTKYQPPVGVPDPYRSVYGFSEKNASGLKDMVLSKIAKVRERYGDTVADQLSGRPEEVFLSLPSPLQDEIRSM